MTCDTKKTKIQAVYVCVCVCVCVWVCVIFFTLLLFFNLYDDVVVSLYNRIKLKCFFMI